MHHTQAIQLIDQVFTTATRIGGTIPKPLKAERDKLARLSEKVRSLDSADVASAVLDALEADKDPATDTAVVAAVVRRIIADTNLSGVLDRRTTQYLIDNADALLALFQKPFEAAADTLTAAHERLGDVDLGDAAAVLTRGGDAASVWAEAQQADQAIHQVQQAWKIVGSVVSAARHDPRYRLLVIADVPPAEFTLQPMGNDRKSSGWDAVRAGYPLSLATPTTLKERISAVHAEQERRTSQAAGSFTAEYRRTHGAGVR